MSLLNVSNSTLSSIRAELKNKGQIGKISDDWITSRALGLYEVILKNSQKGDEIHIVHDSVSSKVVLKELE